jgi:hypothetical protein
MKKFLMLVLVLGFAASANAAIMLSVDGDTSVDAVTIAVSDWITIDVWDDQANGYRDDIYYMYIGTISEGGYTLANARPGSQAGDFADHATFVYADHDGIEITQADTATPDPGPGDIFLIDLHCEQAGVTVNVVLYDNSETQVLDTLTITQIPEPATLALLSLGGLLLRRRK